MAISQVVDRLSSPLQGLRGLDILGFSNILIILLTASAYLVVEREIVFHLLEFSLAGMIVINYLDLYSRILAGVDLQLFPLLVVIRGPSGSSASLDLGQVSAIALIAVNLRRYLMQKGSPPAAG